MINDIEIKIDSFEDKYFSFFKKMIDICPLVIKQSFTSLFLMVALPPLPPLIITSALASSFKNEEDMMHEEINAKEWFDTNYG